MLYFPCSSEHKMFLLFTGLNNEDTNIFWDGELTKQSATNNLLSCKPVYNMDLQAFCQTK